jgi:hypothetical protein
MLQCDRTLFCRVEFRQDSFMFRKGLSLDRRIERLEHAAHAGHHVHAVRVPYVADDAGQAEAQRLALERNPAPRGTKLTLCRIDYSRVEL